MVWKKLVPVGSYKPKNCSGSVRRVTFFQYKVFFGYNFLLLFSCAFDHYFFIFGRVDVDSVSYNEINRFDLNSNVWELVKPKSMDIPPGRLDMQSSFDGKELLWYIFGGTMKMNQGVLDDLWR